MSAHKVTALPFPFCRVKVTSWLSVLTREIPNQDYSPLPTMVLNLMNPILLLFIPIS